jgi:hypothetical protein
VKDDDDGDDIINNEMLSRKVVPKGRADTEIQILCATVGNCGSNSDRSPNNLIG